MTEKLYWRLTIRRAIVAAALLLLSLALWLWRLHPSFRGIYPRFSRAASRLLSRVFSLFPFPIAEILLYILAAGALAALIYMVIRMITKPGRLRLLARSAANLTLALSAVLLAFLLFWGMNYFAARGKRRAY